MDTVKTKRYLVFAALLVLTAAGLFIRVRGLSAYHYSPDEAIELWISDQPTLTALWQLGSKEPHPPLRYVVLHGMMAVSHDPLFIRSFSLVPAILLIWVFFALGRRASGTAAGLAMAALAAFGSGGVLISEVGRPYPLAALAQSGALYFWLSYLDDRRPRRLVGFGCCAVIALFTVYIQAMVIASIYVAWLLFLLARRQPAREYRNLALTTAPLVGAMVFLYFIHLQKLFATPRFANPVESWIAPFFFSDVRGLLANSYNLFEYLFLPPVAAPAIILTLFGLATLVKRSRWVVVAAALILFGLNIALTLAGKFSFGGIRHSFHFFPFIALAFGAAVQTGWDWVSGRASLRRAAGRRPIAVLTAGFSLFLAATLALVWFYSRSDYLRRYSRESWRELPVLTENYNAGLAFFQSRVKPGDLVFASYQTILYLELETSRNWIPVSQNLGKFNYRGQDWYFLIRNGEACEWDMPPPDEVRKVVAGLAVVLGLRPDHRVWIVNTGWNGKVEWMSSDPFWSGQVAEKFERPEAGVYEVPARALLER